jgi:hypothetical protein
VTYGSLCLISFLHHFGSSPSYRPSFRSRWYLSLVGFVASVWVMFKINTWFALSALILMVLLYLLINNYHRDRKGLVSIFTNALFQLNRSLQVYLQQTRKSRSSMEWRPSAICISRDSFQRDTAFQLLNWISYKYGFGTYIHLIEDYYSRVSREKSEGELDRLIRNYRGKGSHVYVDTMISPSYTSAVAQSIQLPGISGMENNMVIFEYDRDHPESLKEIVENFSLVSAGKFDVCIFGSCKRSVQFKNGIHVWIRSSDYENSHLMILLSFIIQGHPAWKKSEITIFDVCGPNKEAETRKNLEQLVRTGRLPITSKNIQVLSETSVNDPRELVRKHSAHAGLCIIGFHPGMLKDRETRAFNGYEELGNILFVNSHSQKEIE